MLPEDAGGGDQVGPVIMVVDRDSRERGGGRLEFMLSGDSQPFTLEFTALADGWWELIVKTVGDVSLYPSEPLMENTLNEIEDTSV